jgi:hypothetical protein
MTSARNPSNIEHAFPKITSSGVIVFEETLGLRFA